MSEGLILRGSSTDPKDYTRDDIVGALLIGA